MTAKDVLELAGLLARMALLILLGLPVALLIFGAYGLAGYVIQLPIVWIAVLVLLAISAIRKVAAHKPELEDGERAAHWAGWITLFVVIWFLGVFFFPFQPIESLGCNSDSTELLQSRLSIDRSFGNEAREARDYEAIAAQQHSCGESEKAKHSLWEAEILWMESEHPVRVIATVLASTWLFGPSSWLYNLLVWLILLLGFTAIYYGTKYVATFMIMQEFKRYQKRYIPKS